MASKAFAGQQGAVPHLVKNELSDLRNDVDAAFEVMEQQVEYPLPAEAHLAFATNATATDTVVIGTLTFDILAALAAPAADHVVVLRGGTAAATLANLIAAINQAAPASPAVYQGSHALGLKASVYNTTSLRVQKASYPGGPAVAGPGPALALSETLTPAGNVWDQETLANTGWGGTFKRTIARVVVDATNLATNFDLQLPFVPYRASCVLVTDAAGVPDGTGKAASVVTTLNQALSSVTVDLDVGATDPVATDVCYFEVIGL